MTDDERELLKSDDTSFSDNVNPWYLYAEPTKVY